MSSNKNAKQKLIELYGAEDFIDKLHLREEKDKHYTGQGQMKRMQQLSYHHILEKSKGRKSHSREWCVAFGRKSPMV